MFTYPIDHSDVGIIYGIDPGSIRLGLSLCRYDFKHDKILSISTTTIAVDKLCVDPMQTDVRGAKAARLTALSELLYGRMCIDRPVVLSLEAPFYNRLRPNAYGTLVETSDAIKLAYNRYSPILPLHPYPPLVVKKAVGVKKSIGKENVTMAMLDIEEICTHLPANLTGMSEHEIDAVAVCYTYITEVRLYKDVWSIPLYKI